MSIFSRINSVWMTSSIIDHPEIGPIHVTTKRQSSRLRLSVKPFEGIHLRLPVGFSKNEAQVFIGQRQGWIERKLKDARQIEDLSQHFFSTNPKIPLKTIRKALVLRLEELACYHRFAYNRVSIRNQKTRWGSCSPGNNLSLNQKLFYLPDYLRDYVLLHELAHTRQKNHSQKFWDILEGILGRSQTKQARLDLRKYTFLFYPPPDIPWIPHTHPAST